MNAAVLDVYAINIMPSQIAKRIKCLPTDISSIEQERKKFKEFLLEKFSLGKIYFSQLDAWIVYNYQSSMDDLFEEDDSMIAVEEQTNWLHEIETILLHKADPANYNEFGGQE